MKYAIWAIPAVLLTIAVAQNQPQTQPAPQAQQQAQPAQPPAQQQAQPQVYGRGRGGLPWAWNDQDKDGICDLSGRPVGQRPLGWGRGAAARGGGRGRGAGAWGGGSGRGPCGRGFAAWGGGRGRWSGPGYAAQPGLVQPPTSAAPVQPKQ